MSLATRCPACNTVFRVVQDQLRVSGGWVRCGHCHEVFNGLAALFELEPDPVAAAPAAMPPAPAEVTDSVAPETTVAPRTDTDTDTETDAGSFELDLSDLTDTTAPEGHEDGADPSGDARDEPETSIESAAMAAEDQVAAFESEPAAIVVDDDEDRVGPMPSQPADVPPPPEISAMPTTPSWQATKSGARKRRRGPKPAFVRQAEQAAQWRRPAIRAVLGSAAAVLGLLLLLQWMHQERNDLAARWPVLSAPLASWCAMARCRIEPPRRLAALTLDSSALSRTGTPQVLQFVADLRNAADHPVRAPALELSFTDNQGRLVVRKVLLPEQLAAPAAGIAAEDAWHIEAPLQVGDLRIAGFSAEVFYP